MTTILSIATSLLAAVIPGVLFRIHDPAAILGLITIATAVFSAVHDFRRSVRCERL